MIYLEDNDVAAVSEGMLTIHRLSSGSDTDEKAVREVHTLKMQIQQIMKGLFIVFGVRINYKFGYVLLIVFSSGFFPRNTQSSSMPFRLLLEEDVCISIV